MYIRLIIQSAQDAQGGSTPNIKKEITYFSLYLLSWKLKKGKENMFLKYFSIIF